MDSIREQTRRQRREQKGIKSNQRKQCHKKIMEERISSIKNNYQITLKSYRSEQKGIKRNQRKQCHKKIMEERISSIKK